VPNRRLDETEQVRIKDFLNRVRKELSELSGGDHDLLFAYRRKLAKELVYDERSKPSYRGALKRRMRIHQNGNCAITKAGEHPLPEKFCVLDRFEAAKGYIFENVQLICETCDRQIQAGRGYR
jgi:hypothetical protein